MSTNFQYINALRSINIGGHKLQTRNAEVKSCIGIVAAFVSVPLVTVRKTAWKKALREMEWFLSGDAKCPDELKDWWSGQLNPMGRYDHGYGEQLRYYTSEGDTSFDQIEWLINSLMSNPNSRRLLTTTWHPEEMRAMTFVNQNPNTPTTCFPGFVNVLTRSGIKQLKDLSIGEQIWDGTKYVKVIDKFSKGIQNVYEYNTRKGSLYCTENHKVFDGKKLVKAKDLKRIHINKGPVAEKGWLIPDAIMDGLIIADGTSNIKKKRYHSPCLHIGKNDYDYFNSEIKHLIKYKTNKANPTEYAVDTRIKYLPPTHEREVPDYIFYGSVKDKCSFLRGYFSGNGFNSTTMGAISTSSKLINKIQLMLTSLGIVSSVSVRPERDVMWKNGIYTSKQAYIIVILKQCHELFLDTIGFLQTYKNKTPKQNNRDTTTAKIMSSRYHSTEEVYDITVDSEEHLFWCNGFTVSNCHGTMTQYFVRGNKLHMLTFQRSADMLLGVPHNWIQYWAFLMWLARRTGYDVGTMQWVFGDAHIYQDQSHLDCVKAILSSKYDEPSLKMEYNETSDRFKASDFKIVGEIPEPVTKIRPKLL